MQIIKIAVASHKSYEMPKDGIYLPVFVGAELRSESEIPFGFTPDNTGENISSLNPYFSELTALYWANKNLEADYIGLTHYRRHFSFKKKGDFSSLLTEEELAPYLDKIKIFVPKKRKYYIETLYSHYLHTFDGAHLDRAREIIAQKHPEYLQSFDLVMGKRSGYMFNMMIMKKEVLSSYCDWLFGILFELRQRIDESEMSSFEKRYPGRVSEILFNVWLCHRLTSGELSKNEVMEIPVVSMERVDYIKKGSAFLKAKFFGRKYGESF